MILHKKISVTDWSFTSSDISKRCIYFLAYIFKNMNTRYCYIIKYLCSTLYCITFILTQVETHLVKPDWYFCHLPSQVSHPQFFTEHSLSGEKSIIGTFPWPSSCTWVTIPLRSTLRHKNGCKIAVKGWSKIWDLSNFYSPLEKTLFSLARSPYHGDWVIPTVLINDCKSSHPSPSTDLEATLMLRQWGIRPSGHTFLCM